MARNLVSGHPTRFVTKATPSETDSTITMGSNDTFMKASLELIKAMVNGSPIPSKRLNKGPPKQAENPILGYPCLAKKKKLNMIIIMRHNGPEN